MNRIHSRITGLMISAIRLPIITSASVVAFGVIVSPANAVTLALWTFETITPPDTTGISSLIIPADSGTGFVRGIHASSSTAWTTPVGNGSNNSLSANNWSVGDYFQFQTSTATFNTISISWDQTSSDTGPRDFQLAYSTDGTSFTNFGSPYFVLRDGVPFTAWNSTTNSTVYNFSVNLSSVAALNNQTNVYFWLINASVASAAGGTVQASGTSRVDNFTVNAEPVPEPISILGGLTALGMGGAIKRKLWGREKL